MSKVPAGLPEADPTETPDETPAVREKKVRTCEKCKNENPRMTASSGGITAYCSCGHWWVVGSGPSGNILPVTRPRGIGKQTLVEPDWDIAFTDLEGAAHGKVGPKR